MAREVEFLPDIEFSAPQAKLAFKSLVMVRHKLGLIPFQVGSV